MNRVNLLKSVSKRDCGIDYVYLLHADSTDRFKIGHSNNPEDRCKKNGQQSPFPIVLVCFYQSANAYEYEQKLHQMFSHRRIHGEWFVFDSKDHAKGLMDEFFSIRLTDSETILPERFNPIVIKPIIKSKDVSLRKFEAIASYCQRKGATTVRKIQQGKLLSDDYKLDSNFIKYALDMLSEQGLISLDKSSEDWIVCWVDLFDSSTGNPPEVDIQENQIMYDIERKSLTGKPIPVLSLSFGDKKLDKKTGNDPKPNNKFMQILDFCKGKDSVSVRDIQRSVGYNLRSDAIKYAFEWLENNGYGTVVSEQIGGSVRTSFRIGFDISKLDETQENSDNPNNKFVQILAFCEGLGSASIREVQRSTVGRNLSLDAIKYGFEWLENNGYGTVKSEQTGGLLG